MGRTAYPPPFSVQRFKRNQLTTRRRFRPRLETLEDRITPNSAPIAVADSYQVHHGDSFYISAPGVLANDSDADQDPLTAELVSDASNGYLYLQVDGSFSYDPDPGFAGSDSFSYWAYDGTAYSNVVTVQISVTNAAPVAAADSYEVHQGGSLYISAPGVLVNDSDADQDTLTTELVLDVSNGYLYLQEDGGFSYDPNPGFVGTDSFDYWAFDGTAYSNVVTVQISVTNAAPVAAADSYEVDQGDSLYVSAPGVLGNDSDADQDEITAELVSDVSNGYLYLQEDGSFSYDPNPGFVGTDSFTYCAFDGAQYSSPVTVTIDVIKPLSADGAVVLGIEQEVIDDVVASFTSTDLNATPGDFTATILWGDGQTSFGTITGSAGSFEVDGIHQYERRGSYAVVVRIENITNSSSAVAGSFAAVLGAEDHAGIQTILSTSLDGGGTLNTTTNDDFGAYDIEGDGSYYYTFTVSHTDGLYSNVDATYTGSLSFEFDMGGESSSSTFTLDNYSLTETGSEGINRNTVTKDLTGSSIRSEVGARTIVGELSKTGSDTYGYYSVTGEYSTHLTITENGVYGGQTYQRDESPTVSTNFNEDGDYLTGNYTETKSITLPLVSWTETGNVWSDTYTSNGTDFGDSTLVETGNLITGAYTVDISGSANPTTTESYTNGVANGSGSEAGDPITFTVAKSANWSSGDYTWDQSIDAGNRSGTGNVTNQTASADQNWSAGSTITLTQTGNSHTGDYDLDASTTSSGSSNGNHSNQTDSGGVTSSGQVTSTLDQTGNVVSGNYTLQQVVTGGSTTSATGANQGASGAATLDIDPNSSVTIDETGNTLTGDYTANQTSSGSSTFTANGSNQTSSSDGSLTTTTNATLNSSGNRLTGNFTLHRENTTTYTGDGTGSNQTTNVSTSENGSTSVITDESGNFITGIISLTETVTQSTTTASSGTDTRGNFTATETVSVSSTTALTDDLMSGSYTLDVSSTTTITLDKSGGDGNTTYSESSTTTTTASALDDVDTISGDYTHSSSSSTTTTATETGDYLTTSFTIDRTETLDTTLDVTGNSITGDYTEDSTVDTTSQIDAVGSNGNGSYDFDKSEYSDIAWTETGNAITGAYSTTGTHDEGSTAHEVNTYTNGNADFTEVLSESFDFSETGNRITGSYTRDETNGIRSSSLDATTINGTDTYTVTQSSNGSFTRTESGNRIDGSYTKSEQAADSYNMTQTGIGDRNFTLTLNGTNTYTDDEVGNTVTGDYTRIKSGTDSYTMDESGNNSNGSYNVNVTGTDNYTMVDTGNLGTGHYTRTIDGDGTYSRTASGAGTSLPSDSGAINYNWQQTGDPHSGTFDMTQTGSSRYDLLEDFYDISNTQNGQTPGHMNVYAFAQPFVDPGPSRILPAIFHLTMAQISPGSAPTIVIQGAEAAALIQRFHGVRKAALAWAADVRYRNGARSGLRGAYRISTYHVARYLEIIPFYVREVEVIVPFKIENNMVQALLPFRDGSSRWVEVRRPNR